ncbi:MAG TPA: pirin family protein, partial [Rugosimonospora sp.]|nr:pirin family protein [Rugosimonospora sp.]
HPHTGLQTVTWLLEGEVLHRDSLDNTQPIRPGQLNLMTSGHGIAHAEVSPSPHPPLLHGLQLWVALPAGAKDGPARFEHHADLPRFSAPGVEGTVLIGSLGGATSPARVHTPLVGADLDVYGAAEVPLEPGFEYAILATSGSATVDGRVVEPGALLYLGTGRSSLPLVAQGKARLFLLGGEPFEEHLVMWWNFVARTHEEIVAARTDWTAAVDAAASGAPSPRFGVVRGYDGAPLPAPEMPTTRLLPRDRHGNTLR